MSPCAAKAVKRPAGYKPYKAPQAELVGYGEQLFKDTSLSSNGMSCASCHQDGAMFTASFAEPYPHRVEMAADQFGMSQIHLDEMIQVCMVAAMAAEPLPWDSRKLAALTAYTQSLQAGFTPAASKANPCAAKSPR